MIDHPRNPLNHYNPRYKKIQSNDLLDFSIELSRLIFRKGQETDLGPKTGSVYRCKFKTNMNVEISEKDLFLPLKEKSAVSLIS